MFKINIGKTFSTMMRHTYFEIDPPKEVNLSIDNVDIKSFGLMLPLISPADEGENSVFGVYTVITSDWTEILLNK